MAAKFNPSPFNRPIPGCGLTASPGSMPCQKPPQFADPQDAAEFIWNKITQPKNALKILASLKAGSSAEFLTRTLLYMGFQNGQWTPDVCILLARPVLFMILTLARVKGMTNIKILNPDKQLQKMMQDFASLIPDKEEAAEVLGSQSEGGAEVEGQEPTDTSSIKIGMLG